MFSKKIILGSASPRRKDLLEQVGFNVEIRKKEVDESFPADLSHYKVPGYLSKLKAEPLKAAIGKEEVLLTSDTVVIHNKTILGKPENREEAIEMIRKMSGDMNEVVTGVYLFNPEKEVTFSVTTKVFFKEFTDEEIEYYVDTYQPYDKAGAYGIQEWIGKIGVQKIEGCFYNVVGLPMNKVWEVLQADFA